MDNTEMLVAAAFLSILAIVAAFGFLITQLIIACFERSKKKREKQKTVMKIASKNHGESTDVTLSNSYIIAVQC
jgi:preprotein translocase subunit SecG